MFFCCCQLEMSWKPQKYNFRVHLKKLLWTETFVTFTTGCNLFNSVHIYFFSEAHLFVLQSDILILIKGLEAFPLRDLDLGREYL